MDTNITMHPDLLFLSLSLLGVNRSDAQLFKYPYNYYRVCALELDFVDLIFWSQSDN